VDPRRSSPAHSAASSGTHLERLPNSKLGIIDAGHFAWEDGAEEYAALVTSWWGSANGREDSAVRSDAGELRWGRRN
jgi:pimeloyl-ACP methyl ester carboxylesterase